MIDATIDNFTNYNTIKVGRGNQSFSFEKSGYIKSFTNYGTTEKMFWGGRVGIVTNYGTMGGIVKSDSDSTLTLNNKCIMRPTNDSWGRETNTHLQLSKGAIILIQNYQIKVDTTAMEFNKFSGYGDNNSHLVISVNNDGSSVRFKDGDSRIILDFGDGFEFGEKYLISKIATDISGTTYKDLGLDFSRLIPRSDIYTLYKQGDYFIARLQPQHSAISNLYKSNIRTMNNFYTMSNSMIYPRKSYHLQNLRILSLQASEHERGNPFTLSSLRDLPTANRGNPLIKESLDSTNSLKSYESFSYRNESVNRRIQRQNKKNYSRQSRNLSQNLKADSANKTNKTNQNNLRDSVNRDYYFILTPFINHNLFFESGRYNLSGLEYGFLTAFSGKLTPSNSLGAHFMMSYGTLSDSKDKDLSIKSLNLNFGLNYKLDLIYDMYLKARGDFFYFLNQVKTLTMFEAIKPNNLGFGASVIFGKDFNFGKGGVLGIEAGIDYKALQSSTISLQNNATKSISETYQKSLYNLIYVDLGMSYNKYFGNFGLNATLGIKGNITANKLATSKIHISTFNQSVDMVLDNDNFLGYANLGVSYVLNHKDFDMEFSVAYYGNFGDRVISNGGGVEWRVLW